MTDRKYSVAEIDRMRAAVAHKWLWGRPIDTSCEGLARVHTSRVFKSKEKTVAVEEMLRTYMLAGIGPEELED